MTAAPPPSEQTRPAGDAGAAIHAACVVMGESGVLIFGPSGAGKSTLARALVAQERAAGRFARLVSCDRTRLAVVGGRLLARPHPLSAGLTEVRGVGIEPCAGEPAARIVLVVEFSDAAPRLPEAAEETAHIAGVSLPRLLVAPRSGAALASITIVMDKIASR